MSETKMKFKGFEWPNNPESIKIACKALTSESNMPFLKSTVKRICDRPRVISGNGYFYGDCSDVFAKRLREEFCSVYPGLLYLPGLDPVFAVFSSLTTKKSAGDESIYYEFEFTESDTDGVELIAPGVSIYRALPGETVYDISAKFGVPAETIIGLNDWIINPLRLCEGTVKLK